MKRTALKSKSRKAQRPDFAVTPHDVLIFRTDHTTKEWQIGAVVHPHGDIVLVETIDLQRHRVPHEARCLRVPDVAQLGAYQHDAEMARNGRAMNLPGLSAPVMVSTRGTARAVPKRRRRYRAADYLAHVRKQPPIGGGSGPVEAHHVNDRALGGDRGLDQVTDDYDAVCLTVKAHRYLTEHHRLPGMSRAATDRALLQGLAETRKAWIVAHEEREDTTPAEDRYVAALNGRGGLTLGIIYKAGLL